MRIKIIRYITIALFLMIAFTLVYYQIIRGQFYFELSRNNRIRVAKLEGWRGSIKDRNGVVLAENRLSYDLMVTPQEIKDKDELFDFLSKVLDNSTEELKKIYQRRKAASFIPVLVAEDLKQIQAIRLEENKYRFPSIIIQESFKRVYPLGANSVHVLGYVGKVNQAAMKRFKEYGYSPQSEIGYSGIEEFYNSYLKGEEGGLQVEVDSRGRQVRLLSLKEPTKGQDIVLTLDAKLQEISRELLDGKVGAVVVLDAHTGEILGMTSSPDFDNNVYVDRKKRTAFKSITQNKQAPLINRVSRGLFPPGSVFKILVAIGGLDLGKINAQTTFFCPGYYELGGIRFGCTHKHGSQNLVEAIGHSCNVYFYRLGLLMGADQIYEYAQLFGLDDPTHVDLPYEKHGQIPSRQAYQAKKRKWYSGNTLNMSIGQGDVLSTPLQLTSFMATVANEGREVQPHLIRKIGGIVIDQYDYVRQIEIPNKYYSLVKKGMRATVKEYSGTAHVLDIPGLYIAGKTGTAQSSGDKEDHAWFVGYVEKENKRLAFCVFLEHGGSSHNASVLARELMLRMRQNKIL